MKKYRANISCTIFEKKKSQELIENIELYRYWRGVQRDQLGISANIYMIFASAILGFVLNFSVSKKEVITCSSTVILLIGSAFLFLSLIFYGWLIFNRLSDFRSTARFYSEGNTEAQVRSLTRRKGELTWYLYYLQLFGSILGFIFSLIGIGIYIYS